MWSWNEKCSGENTIHPRLRIGTGLHGQRAGTPNLEIWPEIRALAQSSAEMEAKGIASGQWDVLSRMVNSISITPGTG